MSVTFQSGISLTSGVRLTAPISIITINTQPANSNASITTTGSTVTYSVDASITRGAQIFYQWEKQESTGGGWSNIAGATANSYTTPSLVYADDVGDLYRCVINGTLGAWSVTSNTANTLMTSPTVPNSAHIVSYTNPFNLITVYGASTGNSPIFLQGYPFGTVTSDYIDAIVYEPNYPYFTYYIGLKQGSYTGFSVDSAGAIDGDLATYPRTFTIGGNTLEMFYDGVFGYFYRGDWNSYLQNQENQTISLVYDPNSQGYYPYEILKPMTYSNSGSYFTGANADAYAGAVFGILKSDYLSSVYYDYNTNYTYVRMKNGTYSIGGTSVTVTNGAIGSDTNGSTKKFTFDGNLYTLTFNSSSSMYRVSTDVMSLATKEQTGYFYSVSYDPSQNQSQGGGGGGGGAAGGPYVAETDYTNNGGPPGLSFGGPPGGPYNVTVFDAGWSNTTGRSAIYGLTTGAVLNVVINGTSAALTLTSGWTNFGPGSYASATSSVGGLQGAISSVSFSAGTEINVVFGMWGGGGGQSQVQFGISSSDTAAIAAASALTTGSKVKVKQGSSSATVTLSSGFTTFPAGPGTTGFSATTVESNQYFASGFDMVTSIVI